MREDYDKARGEGRRREGWIKRVEEEEAAASGQT
jgi:hypothetical protein